MNKWVSGCVICLHYLLFSDVFSHVVCWVSKAKTLLLMLLIFHVFGITNMYIPLMVVASCNPLQCMKNLQTPNFFWLSRYTYVSMTNFDCVFFGSHCFRKKWVTLKTQVENITIVAEKFLSSNTTLILLLLLKQSFCLLSWWAVWKKSAEQHSWWFATSRSNKWKL